MKTLIALLSASVLLGACSAASDDTAAPKTVAEISLSEGWVLSGFNEPESIIPDGSGGYFVSNVNGQGRDKDGNGYISRISSDGKMVTQQWADGLDAPKGMALWKGTLYVTDIDRLVMIDSKSGDIINSITVPEASFFNDVAASDKGVFVSDSGKALIRRVDGDTLPIWLEDIQLNRINGLLPQDGGMLVTTMAEGDLLSIDWSDKSITALATGMINADGLGKRPDGSFLVSSYPGQIWHAQTGQPPRKLLDTSGEAGINHNDTLFEDSRVLSPNWQPGTVREYLIVE